MSTATLTSKGQITLPVSLRKHLGLSTGDRVEFVLNEDSGRYEVVPATQSVQALKGIVPKLAQPLSIAQISAVIASQGDPAP